MAKTKKATAAAGKPAAPVFQYTRRDLAGLRNSELTDLLKQHKLPKIWIITAFDRDKAIAMLCRVKAKKEVKDVRSKAD